MAALNACLTVGYVAGAALRGIEMAKVEIETVGTLDLRGFLGIDPGVRMGYATIHDVARLGGTARSPSSGRSTRRWCAPRPTTSTSTSRGR